MRLDPDPGSGGDWTGQRAQEGANSVSYEEVIDRARRQAGLGSSSEAETAPRRPSRRSGSIWTRSWISVSSSLDAFVEEIGKREGANADEASSHARIIVDVLREAIGQDEVKDLRRRLPSGLGPLFD